MASNVLLAFLDTTWSTKLAKRKCVEMESSLLVRSAMIEIVFKEMGALCVQLMSTTSVQDSLLYVS